MNKHIRTEHLMCRDCGHEFWSKYPCPPSKYATEEEPICGICGSRNIEYIGYRTWSARIA